jgi:hypothetical protein
MAGSDVPVTTVNPESIRELYREPVQDSCGTTRVNRTRVVRHDLLAT